MGILQAIGLAQLQTMQHLLTELEREGVTTLAEARVKVAREFDNQHSRRTYRKLPLNKSSSKIQTCPDCNLSMMFINTPDDEDILGLWQCKKCRYSIPVEVV